MNDASDEVVYRFEVSVAIFDANGRLLHRADSGSRRCFSDGEPT